MTERIQKAQLDYFELEGKTVIVTGSANGIGRATAIMFADLGANVTVCDVEGENAVKVSEEIGRRGGKVISVTCDVTKLEDIQNCIAKTVEAFGDIDVLVNNAAGCGGGKRIEDMTYPEWDRLIKLNLTSAYMFTMEVLPYLIRKNRGKIVNVSSGAGVKGDFSDPHYAAAKAGLLGLTKEMAIELAKHHINVNALGTGLCDTRMAHLPDRSWEDETKSLLWYRAGTPEDMASAICYLSGKSGDYLTGQIVCPNGGEWM